MQVSTVVHTGSGQQNNFFGSSSTRIVMQGQRARSPTPPPITEHQPSPLTTPDLVALWSTVVVEQDEVASSIVDYPWIIPSTVVNAVINCDIGHSVDLAAVARATRDRVKVERLALPASFRGLEYRGLRFGHRVSRNETSSSNFPNQLSLIFDYGRSHVHVMLFDSGSVKLAGVRRLHDARQIVEDLLRLPKLCASTCSHGELDLVVSMYKRSYRLPMELKLEELAYELTEFSHPGWSTTVQYGITRSTAVKFYMRDRQQHQTTCRMARRCARSCIVSLGIFRTGFVMATGRSTRQLRDAMDVFCDFIAKHYDLVVEHTAEDLFDIPEDDSAEDEFV